MLSLAMNPFTPPIIGVGDPTGEGLGDSLHLAGKLFQESRHLFPEPPPGSYDQGFCEGSCRNDDHVFAKKPLRAAWAFGFPAGDGHEHGRVDDDRLGRPSSS
jgi:hypothetical protein